MLIIWIWIWIWIKIKIHLKCRKYYTVTLQGLQKTPRGLKLWHKGKFCHILFELEFDSNDEIIDIDVVVGEYNADVTGDEEDEIKVEKIIKHPDYNDKDAGQMAL